MQSDCSNLIAAIFEKTALIGLLAPKMMFWVNERIWIPVRQDMMGGSIIEIDRVHR